MNYTSREVYEFISTKTKDPIVQWKTCAISGAEFPIYQSDVDFYDKISPSFNGVKYSIPTPTLCPEERQRRRLMFRNERKLYKRKCDASGKDIISIYSPVSPYKVYEQNFRWSDAWEPLEYGREFDFSKSFNQQFKEFFVAVPHMALINIHNQNAEYNNYLNDSKNCYLCLGSGSLEDAYFCKWTYEGKDLIDCEFCFRGENSYMDIACEGFHQSFYCIESKNISECYYCFDCENSSHCLGCVGLRNAQYCIFNQQLSKEEYTSTSQKLLLEENAEYFTKKVWELRKKFGHSHMRIISSETCFGNDIKNCKNSIFGFELDNIEESKYSREIFGSKNVQDFTNGGYSERLYEFHGFGWNHNVLFTMYTGNCKNMYCCAFCQNNCAYCFGCIGLKNKQYCIFNKQYTQEEYEVLVPRIIEKMKADGEWGEFFAPSLSPFGYNETIAHEYFPLSQQEALARGYTWQENNYDPTIPEGADTIKGDQIPSDIATVDDDILKKIFICEVSGRPFRIIRQELEFYRKHQLPLPRRHPDVRHEEKLHLRPARDLYLKTCDHCGVPMLSVYPPNYEGKVYCEECYTKELY